MDLPDYPFAPRIVATNTILHTADPALDGRLIPLTRNDPGAVINRATSEFLGSWTKPFLTAYSDGDPATRGWDVVFQQLVPGARGQAHTTIAGAGHFVQEDRPRELARVISAFIGTGLDAQDSGRAR